MVFDIINEPCIPVRLLNGKFVTYSVRDVFKEAHNIESVFVESIFEEYGIKRFLVSFFMDWLKPQDDNYLRTLNNIGHFDMQSFDSYVNFCNLKGDVFNLFSENSPFYQTKLDLQLDAKLNKKKNVYIPEYVPVNAIFYDYPSNTNHTFLSDGEKEVDAAVCFRGLTALSTFLYSMGGEGYHSGVNGDSPYYIWIKGYNLFNEIIINSVSIETWDSELQNTIPYDYDEQKGIGDHVAWRRNKPVGKSGTYTDISLLEGLTFYGRRVLLKSENNNMIKNVLINPSSEYSDDASLWRDPHCTYYVSKKGLFPKKPSENDIPWISLQNIYKFDNKIKPMTLLKFGSFNSIIDARLRRGLNKYNLNKLDIIVYGGYNPGSKGIYKWWKKDYLDLNIDIMTNPASSDFYMQGLSAVEEAAKVIKTSMKAEDKEKSNSNISREKFYSDSKYYIDTVFIKNLLDINVLNEDALIDLKKNLIQFAKNCYESEVSLFDSSKLDFDSKKSRWELYYNDLNKIHYTLKKKFKL